MQRSPRDEPSTSKCSPRFTPIPGRSKLYKARRTFDEDEDSSDSNSPVKYLTFSDDENFVSDRTFNLTASPEDISSRKKRKVTIGPHNSPVDDGEMDILTTLNEATRLLVASGSAGVSSSTDLSKKSRSETNLLSYIPNVMDTEKSVIDNGARVKEAENVTKSSENGETDNFKMSLDKIPDSDAKENTKMLDASTQTESDDASLSPMALQVTYENDNDSSQQTSPIEQTLIPKDDETSNNEMKEIVRANTYKNISSFISEIIAIAEDKVSKDSYATKDVDSQVNDSKEFSKDENYIIADLVLLLQNRTHEMEISPKKYLSNGETLTLKLISGSTPKPGILSEINSTENQSSSQAKDEVTIKEVFDSEYDDEETSKCYEVSEVTSDTEPNKKTRPETDKVEITELIDSESTDSGSTLARENAFYQSADFIPNKEVAV